MRLVHLALSVVLAGTATLSHAQAIQSEAARARDFAAKAYLRLNPEAKTLPNRVLVRFDAKSSPSDRASARASAKGLLLRQYRIVPGMELIDSPLGTERAMEILARNPHVVAMQPDYVRKVQVIPNDTHFGLLWGMNQGSDVDINAPEAWDTYTGDQEFVIADVDTGIDYNHPDLVDNMWTNAGEIPGNSVDDDGNGYVDDVRGYDFVNGDSDPIDDHSHGTHTSGTIGGRGNNALGVAGVNWRCRIMAVKVFDVSGNGADADIAAGMEYVLDSGIKLSSHSWGGGGLQDGSDAPLLYAACQAMDSAGHLMVFAAGNAAANNDAAGYVNIPSSYDFDNILAVMAIDSAGNRSSFSSYGATKVDLAAPGTGVYSTVLSSGYASYNGTSMATPHVTGAAALLWAYHPGLTSADVKGLILANTKPLAGLAGYCVTEGMLRLSPIIVNAAPTGSADVDQVIEATGPTTSITLSATATDADKDPLLFSWSEAGTGIGTGSSLNLSRGVGSYTFDLTVSDQHLASFTDAMNVTVQDTTAPAFGALSDVDATATSTSGAVVTFSTPNASDVVDGTIPGTLDHASGSTFAPGSTTVNVSATDSSSNTGYGAFDVNVTYAWSGFQSPRSGQSLKGSKVTVKFKLTGASAGITNLAATGSYASLAGGIVGPDQPIGTFSYSRGTYSLVWPLSGLAPGPYRLSATFGDGVARTVDVIVK